MCHSNTGLPGFFGKTGCWMSCKSVLTLCSLTGHKKVSPFSCCTFLNWNGSLKVTTLTISHCPIKIRPTHWSDSDIVWCTKIFVGNNFCVMSLTENFITLFVLETRPIQMASKMVHFPVHCSNFSECPSQTHCHYSELHSSQVSNQVDCMTQTQLLPSYHCVTINKISGMDAILHGLPCE